MTMLLSRDVFNQIINDSEQKKHEGQMSVTHGFVPHQPVPTSMPPGYEVLDELAGQLPELLKTYQERKVIEEKLKNVILDMTNPEKLPDEYLARASIILDSLAHAYYFNQRECPINKRATDDPLPEYILKPWKQVTDRIGRPEAIRTNFDNFMCNWVKTNPAVAVPETLDDVQLLVPAFNNSEEKVFDLTIMLMELKFAPAIPLIMDALEAMHRKDDELLIQKLNQIKTVIEQVTKTFGGIEVNPHHRHFVDPVIWTKTVARFDGPIRLDAAGNEIPGVSGSSSPLFHVMDYFLEREKYDTELGRQIKSKQRWMPKQHVDFLDAIASDMNKNSLKNYVNQSSNSLLKNTYQSLTDTYVGKHGLLENHRLKVFGFMELNFKAGRKKTNGGHSGDGHRESAPHMGLNNDFIDANKERLLNKPATCPFARKLATTEVAANVSEIILDISHSGIQFQPGDRCALLPENSNEIITEFLITLNATGNEFIQLTTEWQQYLLTHYQITAECLSLKELLKYAQLTSLDGQAKKNLFEKTKSNKLFKFFHTPAAQKEKQDLAEILMASNFVADIAYTPEKQNFIGNLLQPLQPRLYSISPVYDEAGLDKYRIRLTVGKHTYQSGEKISYGVASHFLASAPNGKKVHIQKVPAPGFMLPKNNQQPVLMFAAGTGIAPFMGFIQERIASNAPGKNYLFISVAEAEKLVYRAELAEFIRQGKLTLLVVCSREAKEIFFNEANQHLEVRDKTDKNEKHIDDLIKRNQSLVTDLITKEYGHVYICGQNGFADTVKKAILNGLSDYQKDETFIYELEADKQYHRDIFTPNTAQQRKTMTLSEIITASQNKLITIINGKVYDLERFSHVHPGGIKILNVNAGIDSTEDYNAIGHHLDPQIESQLVGLYIADVVYPELTPENRSLFKTWLEAVYDITEMKNSLKNNTTFTNTPASTFLMDDVYESLINGSIHHALNRVFPQLYQQLKGSLYGFTLGVDSHLGDAIQNLSKTAKQKTIAVIKKLPEQKIVTQTQATIDFHQQLVSLTHKFLTDLQDKMIEGIKEFENNQNDFSRERLLAIFNTATKLVNDYFIAVKTSGDIYIDSLCQQFEASDKTKPVANQQKNNAGSSVRLFKDITNTVNSTLSGATLFKRQSAAVPVKPMSQIVLTELKMQEKEIQKAQKQNRNSSAAFFHHQLNSSRHENNSSNQKKYFKNNFR